MGVTLYALSARRCNNCIGGTVRSAYIDCEFIDWENSVVNANKQIELIAVTAEGVGQFKEFKYDKDKTAKFDAPGERTGTRHVNKPDAFHKWDCIDLEAIIAGEALKDACCLFGMHELSDGTVLTQGGDVVPDGAGYKLVESLETAKATVGVFTDTSANPTHMDVNVINESRNIAVPMADPSVFGITEALAL